MHTEMRTDPTTRTTPTDRRWLAVLARDPRADGAFVFAVRTTRVYCRPSCPARRPSRANVEFFRDPDAAERAGFRACRRCHPRDESTHAHQAAIVSAACEFLARPEEPAPSLAVLAQRIGYSPWHLHRMFKRLTGVTPRQYARARRADRLKHHLREDGQVTTALYDAGFGSSSRLYENSDLELGMTPGTYGRGGRGMRIAHTVAASPLGLVLVAATGRGVCAVRFGRSRDALERELAREFPEALLRRDDRHLRSALRAVVRGIEGRGIDASLPLDVHTTAFQRRVWDALCRIPAGETRTYGAIARGLGRPRSARAVGRACATNPVAVLIPCHRAVRADGGLGGYAYGLERKRALLAKEKRVRPGP